MANCYIIPNALNGSLVWAVREKDPNARIICLELFPFYMEHLKNNLKVEVYKLDSQQDIMLQLQKLGKDMKINWNNTTVLMNAPYQEIDEDTGDRKDQASNLWGDFMYAFAELVPRMASIQPSSWLSPSLDYSGKSYRYQRFADEWRNNFKTLNIKECAKHFKGVGSDFTYFTLDKLQSYPTTKLITEKGTVEYPFCDNPMLGYNDLDPATIQHINSTVYPFWNNDFGFSRQGYDSLDAKLKPYSLNGKYPIFHTNKTRTASTKPGKKVKKKAPSYMSLVSTVAKHAGVHGTFTYSDVPHPHQHLPKVLVCLSGEFNPILDEHGELGYTEMTMPIICKYKSEARRIHKELSNPNVISAMSVLKWSGFINIEVLMRLKCKNPRLKLVRKNSQHAQRLSNKLNKKYTTISSSLSALVKYMNLDNNIKQAILAESTAHHAEKQAQANASRRAKARTDQTGEVFTPSELVIEILETLPLESWLADEQHFDPAMGNGQFLAGSAIARAILGQPNWLEKTYGVDLMPDNVAEARARLKKIAVEHGYTEAHADAIVNDNLHIGDTLNPTAKIDGQSKEDRKFMKDNFKAKEDKTAKKIKAVEINTIADIKQNTFDNIFG